MESITLGFFLACFSSTRNERKRKEKNRGDEPVWVIIHIYLEMPQKKAHCIASLNKKMPFC
jgi:hypothetical protein